MTTKEIEAQKNLIVACQERLAQAENDFLEAQEQKVAAEQKLQNISDNQDKIKDEIRGLERVVVAELDAEELFNELNALDSNPDKVKHSNPRFSTSSEIERLYEFSFGKKLSLEQLKRAINQFDFQTYITTKARTYSLHSHYQADELINGKPIYEYLHVMGQGIDVYYLPLGEYVNFGFDEDFYKNFKVRLTLAQMKTYPNLETAVMNILKKHEKAENV